MAVDINKQLDRAKRSLEKNKLSDAIGAFEAVLDAVPTHQEAMQALGDLYARIGDTERAARYYGLLFDRLTDPRDEPKALALYTHFLKQVQQPAERVARYALLLQRQNKLEEANEQYGAAAELYLARGQREEAMTCRARMAELDPDTAEHHLGLGEIAEQVGNTPVAARGYVRAAQLADAAGQRDRALELFARAYRLAPTERSVALLYAQARLRQGDAAAQGVAAELLEPFAATESDPVFLGTFGEVLMHVGQLDRAREVLERFYRDLTNGFTKLFELAGCYLKAKQDQAAVEVLTQVKQRMFDAHRENQFAAQVDQLAEANPSSILLTQFWGEVYNELNREAKYFDVLVRLFDLCLEGGETQRACETLERLVDIDAYDFRNQERIKRLEGRADPAYVARVKSRLVQSAAQGVQAGVSPRAPGEGEPAELHEENRLEQALEDLLVQAEIFIQYSLQAKAVERLQKIAEMSPGEEERNERFRNLCYLARWWPPGSKISSEPAARRAPAEAPTTRTGIYSAEMLRDLSKISEINRNIYRQASPRAMLSVAVNEVGTHLRAARCLAVMGTPGQPPQMAAEFCAPGVEPSPGTLIVRLLAQIERAAPDSLGGLPLEAAAASVLREMGLETALGVMLADKETQAPAGMLIAGHATPHKWKPNETYFLQSVGDQMLMGVSHTKLRSLVRTLAVSDEKTGLLGRSSYLDCLLGETQRAKVQGTPLALAILQVDRGPELLRQQGEAQLERFMEQLARAVQPVVRQNDLGVKYTSWALAFILPDTTLEGARNLAEKLRRVAAGVKPPWDGTALTISAAVAEAIPRPDFDNEDIITDLINRAEASLDEARRKGGDTIVSLEIPRS